MASGKRKRNTSSCDKDQSSRMVFDENTDDHADTSKSESESELAPETGDQSTFNHRDPTSHSEETVNRPGPSTAHSAPCIVEDEQMRNPEMTEVHKHEENMLECMKGIGQGITKLKDLAEQNIINTNRCMSDIVSTTDRNIGEMKELIKENMSNTQKHMEDMKDIMQFHMSETNSILRDNLGGVRQIMEEMKGVVGSLKPIPPTTVNPPQAGDNSGPIEKEILFRKPSTQAPRPSITSHMSSQKNQNANNFSISTDESDTEEIDSRPGKSVGKRTKQSPSESIRMPPFKGTDSWKVWFTRFTEIADGYNWDDHQRRIDILPRLQGVAGEFVFGELSSHIRGDYKLLVEELESRFRVVETRKAFAAQFSKRKQKSGESIEEYAAELKRLYDKAYTQRNQETRREDLVRKFLDGLYDDQSRFAIEFYKEPENIDDAVSNVVSYMEAKRKPTTEYYSDSGDRRSAKAVRFADTSDSESSDDDDLQQGSRNTVRKRRQTPVRKTTAKSSDNDKNTEKSETLKNTDSNQVEDLKKELEEMKKQMEALNKTRSETNRTDNFTRWSNNQPTFSPGLARNKTSVQCYSCRLFGHVARECPNRGFQGDAPYMLQRNTQNFPNGMTQNSNQQGRPAFPPMPTSSPPPFMNANNGSDRNRPNGTNGVNLN